MRFLAILLILTSQVALAESILRYNGKEYAEKDLPVIVRQKIAEVDSERYHKAKLLIQEAVLEMYFEEQSKKLKKPIEEIRKKSLSSKEPSEKESKKFYEENKARIPYPYDTIKGEIKKIMMGQKKEEAKTALLAKIEVQKKVRVLLKEPQFPKIDLKTDGFYSKGKPSAKVHIVEFADYQCPHCKHAAESFKKILKKRKDVHFTFVDFPINPSKISTVVAHGAYCANKQGKYWDYHYMAFEGQSSLSKTSPLDFAKKLKLKTAEFEKCLASKEAKEMVERGREEGERVGVTGTPGIFINGRKAHISHDVSSLEEAIKKAESSRS
ncbi:DsbA family protein [Oligoflexaceae bacterium]|nr:DsbA family protein [Oligoflexaceae bacterium]